MKHLVKTSQKNTDTVAVAMSGGVDSSVAALLLKQQGYNVIGVTIDLLPSNDSTFKPTFDQNLSDARKVAKLLGIPHQVINFREQFAQHVIDYFAREYLEGRTPNPCVVCNKHIKFGLLIPEVQKLGAKYLATGHYACNTFDKSLGRYVISRPTDTMKDQTYVLFNLTQDQLQYILFPLADYTKPEIRKLAEKAGLPISQKAESQEICFVSNNRHAEFIERYNKTSPAPGQIVDQEGKVLGNHKGLPYYTIGQRHFLEIPPKSSNQQPLYVTDLDPKNNRIITGTHDDLFSIEAVIRNVNFIHISADKTSKPLKVSAVPRYRATPSPATVTPISENQYRVTFDNPQRALTPGQFMVLYDGNILLGGGEIVEVHR